MRKALIGSFIFHALVAVGLFSWVAFATVDYVDRDVYTVKLVGSVATARASTPPKVQAPPRAEPEPVKEEKVEEKEDVMPAPPTTPKKPKPVEKKKDAVPTTDITKTNAKPDTTGEQGAEGIAGPKGDVPTTGSVSIDGGDFPFASYINRLRQKVATTWEAPPGLTLEQNALIYFRVHRDGSVSDVSVEKSSNVQLFDRSCQRAVLEAAPMAPLPREFDGQYIGVHFPFVFRPASE